jgi:hypothetical protein
MKENISCIFDVMALPRVTVMSFICNVYCLASPSRLSCPDSQYARSLSSTPLAICVCIPFVCYFKRPYNWVVVGTLQARHSLISFSSSAAGFPYIDRLLQLLRATFALLSLALIRFFSLSSNVSHYTRSSFSNFWRDNGRRLRVLLLPWSRKTDGVGISKSRERERERERGREREEKVTRG